MAIRLTRPKAVHNFHVLILKYQQNPEHGMSISTKIKQVFAFFNVINQQVFTALTYCPHRKPNCRLQCYLSRKRRQLLPIPLCLLKNSTTKFTFT
jgi:hypothetical protein